MKQFLWLLIGILLLTAVSCTSPTVNEDAPDPTPVENNDGGLNESPEANPDIFPRVTLTPQPVGEPIEPEAAPDNPPGYPAPPLPTSIPEGYIVPTQRPALNPYPEATGNLIWILKPVGEQCAETPATPDLNTAVADLIALGIPVEASEITNLLACAACGCPTSAHFRMQIDAGYLGNAEVLGWYLEE
ncbi:MAG: hypothetical protein GY805_02090 [Chloroflexi bacterium]|nr:hypothetical protein [Chloroflexota bacterium]